MDDKDEMENAFVELDSSFKIGSLVPTGIKLKAMYKITGKPTSSGMQLDNSRMEIMCDPTVKVEVVGFSEMHKALNYIVDATIFTDEFDNATWQKFRRMAVEAINKADGK